MAQKLAQDAFDYLNRLRKNPKIAIPKLEEQLKLFKGKELHLPGEIPLLTQEGAPAVKECISFLQKQAPLPEMRFDKNLSRACQDHINDIGPKGATGHTSSDGSNMEQRIERYGEWEGQIGENISFGQKTGEGIILQLIIDDGVPSRGHRKNCFNPKFLVVGVACGGHKQFKDMAVFDFATEFIASGSQPQSNQPQSNQSTNKKPDPKSVDPRTQQAVQNLPQRGKPQPPQPARKNEPSFDPDPYVRANLPREEVLEIKQAFDIFDSDGSGSIDPKELKDAFEDLGFKGQNKFIYQVLGELDSDNSGGIDFEEFLKLATAKVSEKDTRDQVQKVFNLYDWNKEGRITWDELKRVAVDLGEDMTDEEIQAMFKKADLDDDGFVTFDDFYNIMTGKVYWN